MDNKLYKNIYEFIKPHIVTTIVAIFSTAISAITVVTVLRNDVSFLIKRVDAIEFKLPEKVDRSEIVARDNTINKKLDYMISKVDYLYQIHIK